MPTTPDVQPADERKSEKYKKDAEIEHISESDVHLQLQDPLPEPGTPERIAAERKLLRKLDMRLLPIIVVIYIMNYTDRNAITTARLQNLEEDLRLSGYYMFPQPSVLSILFVSYCPAQVPLNMKTLLLFALTGVQPNFGGILACRKFIGLPE
ncbi:hypothetical protein MPER_02294, partial [Moniliophthora perniciosa FA553]